MNAITWSGAGGLVRWSYLEAARLGAWTMRTEDGRLTISATVLQQDTYAVSQQPLVFEVPRPGKVPWRWNLTELQWTDNTLRACLVESEE